VVEGVKAYFTARQEVVDVDGVRMLFPTAGFVPRSNTQPVLVLAFRGHDTGNARHLSPRSGKPCAAAVAEA